MTPLVQAFVFLFGAAIGSFLNAAIWRLRTGETLVKGRSYCPSCKHVLRAKDLVPVFSFVFLGGKCRYCRSSISPIYPLVETATGALFLAAAWRLFPSGSDLFQVTSIASLLLQWYLLSVLVIVFVFDLRYMIIPRQLTLTAMTAALVGNLALGVSFWSLLVGTIIGGSLFLLQYLLSRGRWIGEGDIYLGLLMGAILGFPLVIPALFMAYVSGAAVGTVLLLLKAKGWKSELAFGTFLTLATAVTMLWGQEIWSWYIGILL
ncbi:hypothetical protein AMJ57_02875 [Parcubacteria bacterium SG8_24]|nr:MAG: hypothetical protein AMJ57_02875 [Parcubacteria bacterium SG8_24]